MKFWRLSFWDIIDYKKLKEEDKDLYWSVAYGANKMITERISEEGSGAVFGAALFDAVDGDVTEAHYDKLSTIQAQFMNANTLETA